MKILILSLTAVLSIISFGLVDSAYAEHPAENPNDNIAIDVRINNCTSFTIFGNADEHGLLTAHMYFVEYLDNNRSFQYASIFPLNIVNGVFEHTYTLPISVNHWTMMDYNHNVTETFSTIVKTVDEIHQGEIQIRPQYIYQKPHRTYLVTYETNSLPTFSILVRTNPDTNQLCFYNAPKLSKPLADFVKEDDNPQTYVDRYNDEEDPFKNWFDANYPQYDSIYEAVGLHHPSVIPPLTPIEQPKTKLQIANEQIDELETKKEKQKDKKDQWKQRMQEFKEDLRMAFDTDTKTKEHLIQLAESCKDATTELSDLQSRFTILESNSTQTQSQLNEALFTIEKLTTELNEAKKKIEEVETENQELRDAS